MDFNKVLQDEQSEYKQPESMGVWVHGMLHGEAISREKHVNKVLMWECGHCVKGNMKIFNFLEMKIYKSKEKKIKLKK